MSLVFLDNNLNVLWNKLKILKSTEYGSVFLKNGDFMRASIGQFVRLKVGGPALTITSENILV